MENQNLPVPLMRELVLVGGHSSSSSKTPAVASVTIMVVFAIIGVILRVVTGGSGIFLVLFVVGFLLAALLYFLLKRIGTALPSGNIVDRMFFAYSLHFSRLNTAGFEGAVDTIKSIIRTGLTLSLEQPSVFGIIDESLRFLLSRLLAIAEAKRLLGDDRDLKRQCERLETQIKSGKLRPGVTIGSLTDELTDIQRRVERLERLNAAALVLTNDLRSIRDQCERGLVERVAGSAEVERSQTLLRERLQRENRVQAELAQLGL